MLPSSAVDRSVEPWTGQANDYKINILLHLRINSKLNSNSQDWLAWNQDNMAELRDIYMWTVVSVRASSIKIQLSMLV